MQQKRIPNLFVASDERAPAVDGRDNVGLTIAIPQDR
jgi:hypothetical protein